MDEIKEEKKETTQKTPNVTLYIVFAIVLLIVAGGSYWLGKHMNNLQMVPQRTTGGAFQRPGGPPSMKGQKFSDTQLFSQAVQIYPGDISASAKAIMSGWILKTKTLADGTTQADLIPMGSEATEGDTSHSFNLKASDKLYFVDINPNDDGPSDQNTRDDMGIVVDASGMVQ